MATNLYNRNIHWYHRCLMNFEISEHVFNSKWYGSRFGVARDINLLQAAAESVNTTCADFAVVELRLPTSQAHSIFRNLENGFREVDLQIGYRLSTKKFEKIDNGIDFLSSEKMPIDFSDFSDFSSERYLQLPTVTPQINTLRYVTWAKELTLLYPRTCGTVRHNGQTLGYTFGSLEGQKGHFSLGVTSRNSSIPGLAVYQGAIKNFLENGATSVSASFSASNIGALNLHASLGCRFVSSTSIYFWINPRLKAQVD